MAVRITLSFFKRHLAYLGYLTLQDIPGGRCEEVEVQIQLLYLYTSVLPMRANLQRQLTLTNNGNVHIQRILICTT